MDIRVAVLAALSYICEHWLDVTFGAGYRLMQAAKRVSRLIVIEFRDGTDRPPPARGVAVLTGNVQTSVWTVRTSGRLRLGAFRNSGNA
jgi:hypothetical protein